MISIWSKQIERQTSNVLELIKFKENKNCWKLNYWPVDTNEKTRQLYRKQYMVDRHNPIEE